MDEGACVSRAIAGDAGAFALLVRTHQGRVRGFLLRLTRGNRSLTDDLGQETFLEAYRKIGSFRGEGAFGGWLLRIAYSRFLMERRTRKDEAEFEAPATGAAAEGAAIAKLDLERAMGGLSPGETGALTLCYALGYSHEEAAQILNLPLGTVKSHVARGREKLKVALGASQDEVAG